MSFLIDEKKKCGTSIKIMQIFSEGEDNIFLLRVRTPEIPFGIEIKRNYDEIKELHACICNSHPNHELPSFPDENKNKRATIMIQTKSELRNLCEVILEMICRLPDIDDNPHFVAFLDLKKKTKSLMKDEAWENETKKPPIYLDIMIVDARDLKLQKSLLGSLKGKEYNETYATLMLEEQRYKTSGTNEKDCVWNESCTFTYYDPKSVLHVSLLSKPPLGKISFLGMISIKLSKIESDKVNNCFFEVKSLDPNDKNVHGKMTFLIQKSSNASKGFLASYGKPLASIPQRLDIGDLIMFSSKGFVGGVTRIATVSNWDHIAVVTKVKKNLRLLESNSDGVANHPLDRTLNSYLNSCREIGIRRLKVERTQEISSKFEEFTKNVTGKAYNFNIFEILGNSKSEEGEIEKFFCSQLVAKSYQVMGLLPPEVPSSNYLPSSFASDNCWLSKGKLDSLIKFDVPTNEETKEVSSWFEREIEMEVLKKEKRKRFQTMTSLFPVLSSYVPMKFEFTGTVRKPLSPRQNQITNAISFWMNDESCGPEFQIKLKEKKVKDGSEFNLLKTKKGLNSSFTSLDILANKKSSTSDFFSSDNGEGNISKFSSSSDLATIKNKIIQTPEIERKEETPIKKNAPPTPKRPTDMLQRAERMRSKTGGNQSLKKIEEINQTSNEINNNSKDDLHIKLNVIQEDSVLNLDVKVEVSPVKKIPPPLPPKRSSHSSFKRNRIFENFNPELLNIVEPSDEN